jgi:outer membrane protein assembly factor BamB
VTVKSVFSRPLLPLSTAVAACAAALLWLTWAGDDELQRRVPGTDRAPEGEGAAGLNPVLAGQLIQSGGQAAAGLDGAWPAFRGPNRDGISPERTPLARTWEAAGPRELWSVDAGEGYGGAAIAKGRVYLMDYDKENRRSALRCLSLADGREIWRYAYPLSVKRNHGMTRSVPSLSGPYVVGLDPKCNVVCADAASGELRWGISLVREHGAAVPPWYAGQCPLIDGDKVILAPAGNETLLLAVDLATGKTLWKTPNPRGWKMTHSSVMTMEWEGRRMYVYCGSGGVVGVSATDGTLLWDTTDWKISIATVPSPLVLDQGRIFLSGGYNAGSLMLQLKEESGRIVPKTLFRLPPEIFGATQHSPVLLEGRIHGIRANGHFVCLDQQGKLVWSSGSAGQFGLGPFLAASGLVFAMNDNGQLSLFEAPAEGFKLLAKAQVLKGRESWGPMALAGGRLIVRDFTKVVCLDVAAK